MKLKESDIRARCEQRGYRWEDIAPCLIRDLGNGHYDVDINHPSYPHPKKGMPTLRARAVNFTAAAAAQVAAGMPTCSEEQVAERFAICRACDKFDGKACLECGCLIKGEKQMLSKLSWATSTCPLGKWGPVARRPEKSPDPTPEKDIKP
jgi:hypothetical protein